MPTPEDDTILGNSSVSDTRKPRHLASILAVGAVVFGALIAGLMLPMPGKQAPLPAMPAADETALEDPAQLGESLARQAAANLPDLEFHTLDGQKVTLGSLVGHPVLLNFWASWCTPCVKEMPELNALAARHGTRGLRVVVASLNATPAEAKAWLVKHKLNAVLPVMDPGGAQLMKMGQAGLPTTLLIREDGSLMERIDGIRQWDATEMKAKLEKLMAK